MFYKRLYSIYKYNKIKVSYNKEISLFYFNTLFKFININYRKEYEIDDIKFFLFLHF